MLIRPAKCLRGEIRLPGDKSISHRAAMIAAMAPGETTIENFATSADCASTLNCLRELGVDIRQSGATLSVRGGGKLGFRPPSTDLDCGNSGTTMRLLAGILAGQPFGSVMTGDKSLKRRPMSRIMDPLSQMGADLSAHDGTAPVKVRGVNPLRAIEYTVPVASAQIKSCVLLAGLNADGETAVIEKVETRDHTERMLRHFEVPVERTQSEDGSKRIAITGADELRSPGNLVIPGDISAAAFFLVAAACLPDSNITLPSVGLNPTRAAVVEIAQRAGAQIHVTERPERDWEQSGDIRVAGDLKVGQHLAPLGGSIVPNLIDELPILAILGTRLVGGLEVRDAAELRVKETDRIAAITENLRQMGGIVEEFDDGFRVERSRLRGARVSSFGDHRIAMAFAVAGLLAEEGDTEIVGSECVDVSFPGFFEVLENAVVYK